MVTNTVDFFDPLPCPKFPTFKTLNKKVTSKPKQKKMSLNIEREVFSNLIIIAPKQAMDIPGVLAYELAPVPLSLFNLDDTMRRTTKCAAQS